MKTSVISFIGGLCHKIIDLCFGHGAGAVFSPLASGKQLVAQYNGHLESCDLWAVTSSGISIGFNFGMLKSKAQKALIKLEGEDVIYVTV